MTEVVSGIVLIGILTALVYAGDALATVAAGRSRVTLVLIALAGLLVAFGMGTIAIRLSGDGDGGILPLGIGALAAGVTLSMILTRSGRRAVAALIPIDRSSLRAWAGLVALLWLVIFRLATFYDTPDAGDVGQVSLTAAAIQTLAFLGIAAGLIGFLRRRGLRSSLQRLGFDRFSSRSVAIAVGVVVPMAIISVLTVVLVEYVSPGTTERLDDTVNEITGGETSLRYGLALGLFAAAGEETLFRGVLQPKYGLIFTSLVFAVLHVQYDLLLVVASLFPVGLILGLERKYLGTFACIVTHALYNTMAVVLG